MKVYGGQTVAVIDGNGATSNDYVFDADENSSKEKRSLSNLLGNKKVERILYSVDKCGSAGQYQL